MRQRGSKRERLGDRETNSQKMLWRDGTPERLKDEEIDRKEEKETDKDRQIDRERERERDQLVHLQ